MKLETVFEIEYEFDSQRLVAMFGLPNNPVWMHC